MTIFHLKPFDVYAVDPVENEIDLRRMRNELDLARFYQRAAARAESALARNMTNMSTSGIALVSAMQNRRVLERYQNSASEHLANATLLAEQLGVVIGDDTTI